MLCGTSYHSMDAKNRIIIPQTFRSEMGESVYVTFGYDNNLFIMSSEKFNSMAQKVLGVPETSAESREFRRLFFGNAVLCELDKTGRLILPTMLINHAHIQKDVVIIGVSDKLEVWAKEVYEDYNTQSTQSNVNAVLEKMATYGI